jgi:signal transduction histidine kinase/CheY-like chemotaxis protein
MDRKKHLPGYLAVILYALGAAALAAFLIRTGSSDAWLYLLVGPVFLAAISYPRRVYLYMTAGTLLAAASVMVARNPGGGPGLRNVVIAVGMILVNSELLHGMVQARLRAEAELRELLQRERQARADSVAAQERMGFLAEASAALAGSLELEATLRQVVRQAVPHLADFSIIRVALPDVDEEKFAGAHSAPAMEPVLEELLGRYGPNLGLPQPGEAALLERVGGETIAAAARDGEHLRLLRALRPAGALVVPLVRGEHPLGTLTFVRSSSGRGYSPADVDLAKELAQRAAVAIENARLHEALRVADRSKVEFLAMLAHELRNPLSAISNAAYLLEHTVSDVRVERLVAPITRQTRQLARLVDDLLEVSRITRGKLDLRKQPVEVAAATRHAVEAVRPIIEERAHVLRISLPDGEVWIDADPTRYEQVLVNLLVNAARYTEDGGEISLAVTVEEGSVRVSVRDTGLGLAPELLPRIFDLFTQGLTPAAGARGGLGVGLTLVRRLVELHGGSVVARSEGPGRGSEFIATFPGARAEPPAGHVPDRAPAAARELSPLSPSRGVLIIDDDRDAVETLSELLELWGHRVWMAREGVKGIEAARAHGPDAVLLDIGMPGMDGYEVARRLRADPRTQDLLLVALTGYGSQQDRKRSREAGFDRHLVKPVDPEDLRRLLLTARVNRAA